MIPLPFGRGGRAWRPTVLALGLAFQTLLADVALAQKLQGARVEFDGLPYRLESFLGKGGFGEVYLAVPADRQPGAGVLAVKVFLDPDVAKRYAGADFVVLGDGSPAASRFLQTSVPIASSYQPPTQPGAEPSGIRIRAYLAFSELARRENLGSVQGLRLTEADLSGRMRPEHARRIAALHTVVTQVLEGLDHMARKGLSYGDLKPANVFFVGDVKRPVTAASILSGVHRAVIGDLDSISAEPVIGTSEYYAPERYAGVNTIASDHYSVAVSVAELLGWVRPGPPTDGSVPAVAKVNEEDGTRYLERVREFAARTTDEAASRQLLELVEYAEAGVIAQNGARFARLKAVAERSSLYGGRRFTEELPLLRTDAVLQGPCVNAQWTRALH
jgi:serine/threonine protein kinase